MRRYFIRYFGIWKYLILMLMVSLTILVVSLIYDKHGFKLPPVLADINSGVIGALLTAIVTLILVSDQTEKVNLTNQNSTVFREKLEIFNEFLRVLNDSLKDGALKREEILSILFHFSRVRMHVSEENAKRIHEALLRINGDFFHVDENRVPDLMGYQDVYNGICAVLKSELYMKDYHTMPSFDLSNLTEITYEPRDTWLHFADFGEFESNIISMRTYFFPKHKVRFAISDETLSNLRSAYRHVTAKFKEKGVSVAEQFRLGIVRLHDHDYILSSRITFDMSGRARNQLRIFISDKNRVNVRVDGKWDDIPVDQYNCELESSEQIEKVDRVVAFFLGAERPHSGSGS